MAEQKRLPNYGNWVSKKLVYVPAVIAFGLLIPALLLNLLIAILSLVFFLVAGYFAYARYQFSSGGGKVQERIRELLVENLRWDGRGEVLDIGCGNGALAIQLAKRFPEAKVVGIDFWGGSWEYSKEACESNSKIEGVSDRTGFQKFSASHMGFEDGRFDAVVSNLVFHEVKDTKDKKLLIREALRVLKKGGAFAFQDLFLLKSVYGDAGALVETLRSWGITKVEFIETRNESFIPAALKLPFMVGRIGLIRGEK